jgi:hypothetical protein
MPMFECSIALGYSSSVPSICSIKLGQPHDARGCQAQTVGVWLLKTVSVAIPHSVSTHFYTMNALYYNHLQLL